MNEEFMNEIPNMSKKEMQGRFNALIDSKTMLSKIYIDDEVLKWVLYLYSNLYSEEGLEDFKNKIRERNKYFREKSYQDNLYKIISKENFDFMLQIEDMILKQEPKDICLLIEPLLAKVNNLIISFIFPEKKVDENVYEKEIAFNLDKIRGILKTYNINLEGNQVR